MQKRVTGHSTNDELANSFVTMTANFQRLASSEILVVQGVLKQLELEIVAKLQDNPDMSQWRKSRYEALLSQTRDNIKATYTKISDHSQESLTQVGTAASKGCASIFESVGVPLQSVVVTDEQMAALAKNTLIQGSPARSWWAKQSTSLQDAFSQQMRMGFASGETVQQLIRRVRGTSTGKRNTYVINGKTKVYTEFSGGIMDTGTRQAEALVRTAIQQMAADAKLEVFRQNADILKGVMWLATLDNRTTMLCRAHDGLLYDLDGRPIGHKVPFLSGPPAHWNCRSTLIPVTKSFEELGASPGVTKEYLDQIGEGTRASMNGQVPASLTFDAWFQSLPEEDQISFLGPKKYEIWKEAGLTFSEMIDQRGNPLTIAQLAEAYGFKIEQSATSGLPNIPKQLVSAIAVEQQAQALASEIAKEQAAAKQSMAQAEITKISDSKDSETAAVWNEYKSSLQNNAEQDLIFLEAKIREEKEASAEWLKLKQQVEASVGDKAGAGFVSSMEEKMVMEQVKDIALPFQRMAAYENALQELRRRNNQIREFMLGESGTVVKSALLTDLHKEWKAELGRKGKTAPVWDMTLYQSEFDRFAQEKLSDVASSSILAIVGDYELDGSVLRVGNRTFNILDPDWLADFKKYKHEQLSRYKQAILAGEPIPEAALIVYAHLSGQEKRAFDRSLEGRSDEK